MPHHFLLIDNLATGAAATVEFSGDELAEVYGPELRDLLARGQTVRIGDRLVCDMQAFVMAHRVLPDAMTRPPLPANLAARRAGVPQLKRA